MTQELHLTIGRPDGGGTTHGYKQDVEEGEEVTLHIRKRQSPFPSTAGETDVLSEGARKAMEIIEAVKDKLDAVYMPKDVLVAAAVLANAMVPGLTHKNDVRVDVAVLYYRRALNAWRMSLGMDAV